MATTVALRKILLLHGLRARAISAKSGAAQRCARQFCETYGREENVGAKRRTQNAKRFEASFRPQHAHRHLETQRRKRWSERRDPGMAEKAKRFSAEGMDNGKENDDSAEGYEVAFWFDKGIIESVVGGLLLEVNDDDEPKDRSHSLPMLTESPIGANEEGEFEGKGRHYVRIRNWRQFMLIVDYVGCGASFQLASRALPSTIKELVLQKPPRAILRRWRSAQGSFAQLICKRYRSCWMKLGHFLQHSTRPQ